MKVRFDLRPADYIERELRRRSLLFPRVAAAALLFTFCAACGGYILLASLEAHALALRIEERREELEGLAARRALLTAEVARLKGGEERFARRLAFLEAEPPVLEALRALETYLEPGMSLREFRLAPREGEKDIYTAAVDASSPTEEGIVALSDGLLESGVFSAVTVPGSRKDEPSGRVDFNMMLTLRPLGQISLQGEGARGTGRGE